MLFNSYVFILAFLPVVVSCYWFTVNRFGPAYSIPVLALFSYGFYLTGEHVWPWLLAFSIIFNYLMGVLISRAEGKARRILMIFAVLVDLFALGVFKYSTFVVHQFDNSSVFSIALPIGISFYTFTQIAYIVDIYQRKTAENSFGAYALFVTYFPHLIAGPILHHKEMIQQFQAPRSQRISIHVYAGLLMFAIGLSKKTLLADPCGGIASGIFGAGLPSGFITAWVGAVAYTLQIYFDFSGYSDMAIGLSAMLGIRLPVNFNSPYKSTSLIAFWRRWHITLSRFLRDYLYISMGGNRKGPLRRYVNLALTMVLGGIWHGAGWTFLIWGALHGGMLSLVQWWKDRGLPLPPRLIGWSLTMMFVIIAWVPFRAPTLQVALDMWGSMAGINGLGLPEIAPFKQVAVALHAPTTPISFKGPQALVMVLAAFVSLAMPNSQSIMRRFRLALDSPGYAALCGRAGPLLTAGIGWRWVLFGGILLGLAMRAISRDSEFIYFNF